MVFVFLVFVLGYYFLVTQVLMQSAPVLHKLDNVVHEDEYLAPEVFGNLSRAVYRGIASRPTNGKMNDPALNRFKVYSLKHPYWALWVYPNNGENPGHEDSGGNL